MRMPFSAAAPGAPLWPKQPAEFRLVRYFTLTSLVAFVLVAAVLGYVFRKLAIDGLVDTQEHANVDLTRVFSNHLWSEYFGPFVRKMEGRPAAELKAASEIARLHSSALNLMRGTSTFKVKVYDRKGMTIYSTELRQIGEDKSDNAGVIAGWQGLTSSELVHRNSFSALEHEVQNRDLVQSYIPQYDPETGKVIGVFEVYSDVTPFLAEIQQKQWYVMGAVAGLMLLLYLALFVIVNVAQGIIRRQRQTRYRQMFEDNASIACLVDPETRRIVDANKAAAAFSGYSLDELRGLDVAQVSGGPFEETAALMVQFLQGAIQRAEWRCKLKGGVVRDCELYGGPLTHQGKTLLYFILHDITERKRAEAALLESERSKSTFLSAAAHELRTPTTSILGFSELLKTRRFDRETTIEMIETIHRQAGRLVHLLNDALDLSRMHARAEQAFAFARQPLRPLIQFALADLLVPGDPRKVQVEIEDDLPELLLDGVKVRQALINILSNAYKYSTPDSGISLAAFSEGAGQDRRVGIRVSDQGRGMSAEELSHLFVRFWRADGVGAIPGSGLGMALVKEIVEFHGGRIDVRSEPDKGTEITVWLPCHEKRLEATVC
jgi:PAS domain S-box-containing protein